MRVYWDQILFLTMSNMRARYRKTLAGFIWVVLNPIIMYSVQSMVFKHLLKIDIPDYSVFLMGGLLPWLFITQTMDMCTPILQMSGELLKSFKLNPSILVWAQLLDNFFNFVFAFFIILIPTWFLSNMGGVGLVFIPFALINLIIGVGSLVWFLSVFQVFYRDTKFVMQFFTSIMFFLTPIFYPTSRIPEAYQWLIHINPFYCLIEPFRVCLYNFSFDYFLFSLMKGAILTTIVLSVSMIFWKRRKNEFYLFI